MIDNQKTGVGYFVSQLIKTLSDKPELQLTGYYFDLFGMRHKTPGNINGINFKKVMFPPAKFLSLARRMGLQLPLEIFVRPKADIVLYTNYVSLPHLRKRKNVLIIYDLGFLDCPEFTQEKNLRFLQKFCPPSIRSADLIVTISEFTKHRIEDTFPNLKAPIIVTPIPPAEVSPSNHALEERLVNLGISTKKYIFFIGTLEPRKNVSALVEAYSLLPREIRETFALVIAGGKGWKDEEIEKKINEYKARGLNIVQTGYVTDGEREALYANASCFVMPSHYEGFGMPIFEAMQHKIPVAVSDIPVFREVAADSAVYFDKDDPSSIAESIQKILVNGKDSEELIIKSQKRLKLYSWEQNAKILISEVNKLTASS